MSGYSEGGANLRDNLLKTWTPRHYSAVEDYDKNLETLRARSYDLYCNNPIGAAALNSEMLGVLGSGLKLFPRIKFQELGLSAEAARSWSRRAKLEFELWAHSVNCDYYRRNNFYELQRIAFLSYLADGDCFCVMRRHYPTAEMPYTIRLQLIEAARVSNPQGKGGLVNQVEMRLPGSEHRIINGVEIDGSGRLSAVWISNRIWNEPVSVRPELRWQRVKVFGKETGCRNVLHICFDTRTEQYRGIPFLAPVIRELKQITRYGDAELAAAIVKSYFSLFFIQPTSNFDFNDILPEDKNEPVVDVREYKLTGTSISALPRGVDVKAIDRSNAQSTFSPFTDAFLKQIGAALGVPYEILTKQFQASYSASRAALMQAQDEFKQRRQAFINDFCQPIYQMWLDEAVATGRLKVSGEYWSDPLIKMCWSNADFRTEDSKLLDPVKEIEAARLRIELGLSTRTKEAAELTGTDFNENVAELAIENQLMAGVSNE